MSDTRSPDRPARVALAIAVLAVCLLSGFGVGGAQAQEPDFVVAVLPFSSSDDGKAKDLQKGMIEGLDELGPYTLVEQKQVNDA